MTLDLKLMWGMVAGTALAVAYMFNTFATASEMQQLNVDIWYQSYYLMLDDYDEAMDEGNAELADEYKHRMEVLRGKICGEDPEWARCKGNGESG